MNELLILQSKLVYFTISFIGVLRNDYNWVYKNLEQIRQPVSTLNYTSQESVGIGFRIRIGLKKLVRLVVKIQKKKDVNVTEGCRFYGH